MASDLEIQYSREDTSTLVGQLQIQWDKITKTMKKPNVLLTGMTGAGKSSIINRVFEMHIAQTGTGVPITQKFEMFTHPDRPVVLFDAKGLEHGHHEEFISSMRKFFEEQSKASPTDAIHVIWYVVNSANARFQSFEEILLRDVFRDIPIVVILNKSDISSPEARDQLRSIIEKLQLKNLLGVFDCCAEAKGDTIGENVEVCPKCKSENISIKPRQKLMICDNCKFQANFGQQSNDGLSQVVVKTVDALPEFTREAFISAQFVNFSLKEERSQVIIREYFSNAQTIRVTATLMEAVSLLLTRLSILWDFREGGPIYCRAAAKSIVGAFSFKDKLSLLLTKKKTFAFETTAMGILWTRCLQKLATMLLHDFVKENKSVTELDKEWDNLLHVSFHDLNEENLDKIIVTMETKGLDGAFDYEKRLLVESYNKLQHK